MKKSMRNLRHRWEFKNYAEFSRVLKENDIDCESTDWYEKRTCTECFARVRGNKARKICDDCEKIERAENRRLKREEEEEEKKSKRTNTKKSNKTLEEQEYLLELEYEEYLKQKKEETKTFEEEVAIETKKRQEYYS
jgi:5-hydroxyisourate hydrolase-like protein (transthyretin family)